jgi:hypothetical protein
MNLYDALTNGDGSIKEPHLTSFLYYLFLHLEETEQHSSLINEFIKEYFGLPEITKANFNKEEHIKIEQIIKKDNIRRDCDITIFLNYENARFLINIENKISNSSFEKGQVEEQMEILKTNYPDFTIKSLIILPYEGNSKIELDENIVIAYWYSNNKSIIQFLTNYIQKFNNLIYLDSFNTFLNSFGNTLEQEILSIENSERGPKNKLPNTLFYYLNQIASNWESHFQDIHNVYVKDLLEVFEREITQVIKLSNDEEEAIRMISKFKKGALEAQPKIFTINEKNRVHFNVINEHEKHLFYYPEFLDGEYSSTWKNTKILPLRLRLKNDLITIFYKNKETSEKMISYL